MSRKGYLENTDDLFMRGSWPRKSHRDESKLYIGGIFVSVSSVGLPLKVGQGNTWYSFKAKLSLAKKKFENGTILNDFDTA